MKNQEHPTVCESILTGYAKLFVSNLKKIDIKEALLQLERRSGPIYDQYVKFAFEIKVDDKHIEM